MRSFVLAGLMAAAAAQCFAQTKPIHLVVPYAPGGATDITARLFGERTHRALAVFYSLAVVLIGVALVLGGARWPAWIGLVAFAAHLVWQIRRLDISDPALCLRVFKSNRDAGLLLFAGLLVDAVMRSVS